jgi:hypothetical protein
MYRWPPDKVMGGRKALRYILSDLAAMEILRNG